MMLYKKNENRVYRQVEQGKLTIDKEGRVWRHTNKGMRRAEHNAGPYFQVRAMFSGIRFYALAHRLVWRHFNGEIPGNLQINHKNGNKKDNRLENLELATHAENSQHAVRVLKRGKTANQNGQKNHAAKLSDVQTEEIRLLYAAGKVTQKELAIRFGISHQGISKIVRGDRRKMQAGPTADYTANRSRGGGHHHSISLSLAANQVMVPVPVTLIGSALSSSNAKQPAWLAS